MNCNGPSLGNRRKGHRNEEAEFCEVTCRRHLETLEELASCWKDMRMDARGGPGVLVCVAAAVFARRDAAIYWLMG